MRTRYYILPGMMVATFAIVPNAFAGDLASAPIAHSHHAHDPATEKGPAIEPSNTSPLQSAAVATPAELNRNKALVKALFDIIYGTSLDDIPKIDVIVAEDYIQHNPSVGPGREGLRGLLKMIIPEPKALSPADTISVQYIAEGDRVVRQELRKNGMLIDIFRIKDGKLQEHWDAFRFNPGAERIPGF
jgi:predicted SnoaL-like aldol condensation-catalyzing enzyme